MSLLSSYRTRGVSWNRFRNTEALRSKPFEYLKGKPLMRYDVMVNGNNVGAVFADDELTAMDSANKLYRKQPTDHIVVTLQGAYSAPG